MHNKQNKNLFLLLLLGLCALWAQRIEMEVGEQKTIYISGVKRVDYTGPIDVSWVGEKLLIVAKAPGFASIIATTSYGEERREVHVYARSPERVIEELRELLKDVEGISLKKAGGKVIVEGKLITETDKIIFDKIMAFYPDVIDMTEKTDLLVEISAMVIDVNIRDLFNLEISPKLIDTISAPVWIWLKKSGELSQEIPWSISVDVLKSISSLIELGKAKVISNPRVVTNNGKKAEILAGGEIPYQVIGPEGTPGVEWKTYGIKMEVTPQRKITGEIFMELYVEASEPGSGEPPSVNSRNVRMQVSVPNGKTLIIGGLFNTHLSKSTEAGCLFPLFGFNWERQKREILILVTPKAPSSGIPIGDFKEIKEGDIKR